MTSKNPQIRKVTFKCVNDSIEERLFAHLDKRSEVTNELIKEAVLVYWFPVALGYSEVIQKVTPSEEENFHKKLALEYLNRLEAQVLYAKKLLGEPLEDSKKPLRSNKTSMETLGSEFLEQTEWQQQSLDDDKIEEVQDSDVNSLRALTDKIFSTLD